MTHQYTDSSCCFKSPTFDLCVTPLLFRANYGRFSLSICNSEALGSLRTSCDSSQSTSNILRTRYLLGWIVKSTELRPDKAEECQPAVGSD